MGRRPKHYNSKHNPNANQSIEQKLGVTDNDKLLTISEIEKMLTNAKYELSIALEDNDYFEATKANKKIEKCKYLKRFRRKNGAQAGRGN